MQQQFPLGMHFMPPPGRLFQIWLLPDWTASPGSLLCCKEHLVVKWTAPHPMKQCSEFTLILPSWSSVDPRDRAEPFHFLLIWRSSQSDCGIINDSWSVPSFGHRAPKTFVVSRVIGLSFVIHKEPLWNIPESMQMRLLKVMPLDSFWILPRH